MTPDARQLRIDDFTYDLPEERIARHPLPDRGQAKLLQYREGNIREHIFRELPELLPPNTLLIGNETRVIHARLRFPVEQERPIEVFCLEPLTPADYAQSLGSPERVTWKCLIGGNRRWRSGRTTLHYEDLALTITRGDRLDNAFRVTFDWQAPRPVSFGEVLDNLGNIPLPPYLNRAAEQDDRQRYQTVFAREAGSVAAPTAGLHFTPEILQDIQQRGITWQALTLHVGAGTFKPVTSDTLGDHVMHREYFSVSLPFLRRLHEQLVMGAPVVSVGTTSMRVLESLFYFGATLCVGGNVSTTSGTGRDDTVAVLDQWVASDHRFLSVSPAPALSALIHHLEKRGQDRFTGYTQLLITPGVRPRIVDGLITNFHQPSSTLLLLVAAVVGPDWRRVYDYALGHDFRFLSYGDSSLLWRGGTAAQ